MRYWKGLSPGWYMPALLAVCLAGLTGCGSSGESQLPVEGKVWLGEKPLTTGAVILRPDAAKGNTSKHEPRGKIDAEGKYQVMTALREGAPPGWYKVGVIATEAIDPKNPYSPRRTVIPTKYNDPAEAGLSFEVVPNPPVGQY